MEDIPTTEIAVVTVPAPEAKRAMARRLRRCRTHNIIDQTGVEPSEVAIYTLSDPRDVQAVRYVGQTRNPLSRYSQHINAARLWLPDELPWWIKREELRPLYSWIRGLYAEDQRLPMMFVVGWTSAELARSDERRFVRTFVVDELSLLNHEATTFGRRRKKAMERNSRAGVAMQMCGKLPFTLGLQFPPTGAAGANSRRDR